MNRILGEGSLKATIALVGMNPGAEEDRIGRPFVGPSGRLLRSLINDEGDVWYTNVVNFKTPKNRQPTAKERKECAPFLQLELDRLQNLRVVVALGAFATGAFGGGERGVARRDERGFYVLPTVHPAAVLRNPNLSPILSSHLRYAKTLVDAETAADEYEVVTADSLPEVVKTLRAEPTLAFDIETNMANRIWMIGVSNERKAYVFPEELVPWAMTFLEKLYSGNLVGHNAIRFDAEIIRQNGHILNTPHDTMLTAYMLEEFHSSYSLEATASWAIYAPPWKSMVTWDWSDPASIDWQRAFEYNARDCLRTARIFSATYRALTEPQRRVYNNILRPASAIFENISKRGVYIDPDALSHARSKYEAQLKNPLPFNPLSPQQVAKVVGPKNLPHNKNGAPKTDETTLREVLLEHPELDKDVNAILVHRKSRKMLSTYIDKIDRLRDDRGRIHPSYLLTRTVTGRTSCVKPNYENTPRDADVRSIMSVPPGYVFLEADFSQIELRVAAFIARESKMLDAFRGGKDLHMLFARELTGREDVTKEERTAAKIANFSLLYCAEADNFRRTAFKQYGIRYTPDEAQRITDSFYESWPALEEWYRQCCTTIKSNGYIDSIFGRRRHLPGVFSTNASLQVEAFRQGINFTVQSAASDIALVSLILLSRMGLPVIGFCHDAIHFEIKEEFAEEAAKSIEQTISTRLPLLLKEQFGIELDVPLPVEVVYGKAWGINERVKT